MFDVHSAWTSIPALPPLVVFLDTSVHVLYRRGLLPRVKKEEPLLHKKGAHDALHTHRTLHLRIWHRPGFVAYSVIKTGETSAISLTVWESREQAEAAIQDAASWARQNVAEMIESVQNHVGEVAFTSDTLPRVS